MGKPGRVWDDGAAHVVAGTTLLLEEVILVSNPPVGMCRILNVYWNPETGKAVFEYEDTPV
jgi:hypothetical protein